ncbi:MAG: hypothetical protein NC120_04265 [Ruminococcus sp.]|nr:hypothetical protein [Ruminococcus sp.]
MNILKKAVCAAIAAFILSSAVPARAVSAEEQPAAAAAVSADMLNDGTYEIEVRSSSSMFRITSCTLTVSGGSMTARMTLSGKGYEKLFMGTGEEADGAAEEEFIYFHENDEGMYDYTVPVTALDTDTDCAAWSIRKEKWYDRTLVFRSDTLPESAFAAKKNYGAAVTAAAAGAAAGVLIFFIVRQRKKRTASDIAE